MKKSAFISDIIFAFLVVFLPAVCLFRYWRFPLAASVALAALTGALASLLTYLFLRRKRERLCLKKQDEETRDKLLLHLALQGKEANLKYFSEFFETHDAEGGESTPVNVRVNGRKDFSRLETEEALFFPLFSVRPVDGDAVAAILRVKSEKRKYLLCAELAAEAEKLCARFDIRAITGNEVYLILKKGAFLPEHYRGEETSAPKKKKRLRAWFAKSNSRRFLLGGTLILLTSLITPFPLYYILLGSALVLSAVFVRIFGYR